MNVRIVDTIARDSFHEIFNASLLTMCLTAFEGVEYVCHPSQQRCLRAVLEHNRPNLELGRVRFRSTRVVRREGPIGWVCRYLLGAGLNLWYLVGVPRGTQLIYTYNNPLALWPVNFLAKVLRRRVIVVCHGELELLARPAPWSKAAGWFGRIMRRIFGHTRLASGLRFCVLGDSILRNLRPWLSEQNSTHFFAIDHPYFFGEGFPAPEKHDSLRVGTVGQLTPAKGLYTLLGLAREIPVPLTVVGRTYGFSGHADYPDVHFVAGNTNDFIPRKRYDSEAAALDYVLFAYDTDGYKLTASGAVFDALNLGRPIITLRNDYFDDVLRLPVGYLVEDAAAMAALICRLAAQYPTSPDYPVFLENLSRLRDHYQVEAVGDRFCAALATLYPETTQK